MDNNFIPDYAPVPAVNQESNANPAPVFVNDWDNNTNN